MIKPFAFVKACQDKARQAPQKTRDHLTRIFNDPTIERVCVENENIFLDACVSAVRDPVFQFNEADRNALMRIFDSVREEYSVEGATHG